MAKDNLSILVIQTTASGIYYHRQWTWAYRWTESGSEFAHDLVAIVEASQTDKIKHLIDNHHFDIVFYSIAMTAPPQNMPYFFDFMKRRGSKIVLDIDDKYRNNRKDVVKSVKFADALTVVSEDLARFYAHGGIKFPYIIENGIDTDEWQFKPMEVMNQEPVFGYLGSTRHEDDLRVMDYDFSTRQLLVVCEEYADVLDVNHYTTLKHWSEYAWEYNAIDVALAPLVDNPFNQSKSQLKIYEAGFKKKPIICSPVGPYTRDMGRFGGGVDVIPIGTSWKDRIESYTVEEARQRGEELYKLVQPYEIKTLNKKRREIFLDIVGDTKPNLHLKPESVAKTAKTEKRGSNYTPPKKKRRKKKR